MKITKKIEYKVNTNYRMSKQQRVRKKLLHIQCVTFKG